MEPVLYQQDLIDSVSQIGDFEWLVFVSRNAVRFGIEAIERVFGAVEKAPVGRVAAIGQTTADLFHSLTGKTVDLVPATADSESLGSELADIVETEKVMIFRGNRGSAVLGQCLSNAQRDFRERVVYQSEDIVKTQPRWRIWKTCPNPSKLFPKLGNLVYKRSLLNCLVVYFTNVLQ